MLNEDYRDMLQCLLEEKVRFLLVGAYAVAVYGYPRATKDIDIFVRAAPENASSLMKALLRFGAPVSDISESDFSREGVVFQIGSSPRRIDILTRISGVDFERAYANRQTVAGFGRRDGVLPTGDFVEAPPMRLEPPLTAPARARSGATGRGLRG